MAWELTRRTYNIFLRCPYIVGKARHELSVCFFRLTAGRQPAFVRQDNIVKFIGERGCKFMRFYRNRPTESL